MTMSTHLGKGAMALVALIVLAGIWWGRHATNAPAQSARENRSSASVDIAATAPRHEEGVSPSSEDAGEVSTSGPATVVPRAVEAGLLNGRSVNADAADRLLRSRNFDAVLDNLAMYGGAEGQDITGLYSKSMGDALGKAATGFNLQRVACGSNICGAVFVANDSGDRLSDLMDTASRGPAKLYSAVVFPVPSADGDKRVTYRMLFSSNPETNAIIAPLDIRPGAPPGRR